jgi:hypothetical protein
MDAQGHGGDGGAAVGTAPLDFGQAIEELLMAASVYRKQADEYGRAPAETCWHRADNAERRNRCVKKAENLLATVRFLRTQKGVRA